MASENNESLELQAHEERSPWVYIFTLYLPFGLIDGGMKTGIPNQLFKLLGFSNEEIGMLYGLGLIFLENRLKY